MRVATKPLRPRIVARRGETHEELKDDGFEKNIS